MTSPAACETSTTELTPTLAVIGIDPGARWTAAVLRIGDYASYGWTYGPVNRIGELDAAALANPDDWAAFGRYAGRVLDALGKLVAEAEQHYGAVRVAIEAMHVPVGWLSVGHGRYNRLPLIDWLTPTRMVAAVLGAYPDARLGVSVRKLPGATIGGISPGQRTTTAALWHSRQRPAWQTISVVTSSNSRVCGS
jgi:hypothetical protein